MQDSQAFYGWWCEKTLSNGLTAVKGELDKYEEIVIQDLDRSLEGMRGSLPTGLLRLFSPDSPGRSEGTQLIREIVDGEISRGGSTGTIIKALMVKLKEQDRINTRGI
jgi:hypothetical protein